MFQPIPYPVDFPSLVCIGVHRRSRVPGFSSLPSSMAWPKRARSSVVERNPPLGHL